MAPPKAQTLYPGFKVHSHSSSYTWRKNPNSSAICELAEPASNSNPALKQENCPFLRPDFLERQNLIPKSSPHELTGPLIKSFVRCIGDPLTHWLIHWTIYFLVLETFKHPSSSTRSERQSCAYIFGKFVLGSSVRRPLHIWHQYFHVVKLNIIIFGD